MSDWPDAYHRTGIGGILGTGGITPLADFFDLTNTGYAAASTAWGTANRAILFPVVLSDGGTVTTAAWINGTVIAGNVDVGIYDMGNVRMCSTGSVAQSGASTVQTANFTAATYLTPGWYKIALASNSTTATFKTNAGTAGNLRAHGVEQATSSFALPNPITSAALATTVCPLVIATYRTTV